MNTPRSKPLIRVARKRDLPPRRPPAGTWYDGIATQAHARLVGYIITCLPHIEERMIAFLARLLGHPATDNGPARQVFRSVESGRGRIKMMEALLQNAFINLEKPAIFDEVINTFDTVKNKRNAYAHGLWYTHESGRVFLAQPSTDMKQLVATARREVTIPELKEDIRRMTSLNRAIQQAIDWIDPKPIPVGKVRMRIRMVKKPEQ